MCASVIIMSACSESVDRRIVLADSLSWSRPDSAMMIMDSIEPTKQSFSKGELMRYELIRAKVQNRAYIDFTTDSVMKEVADYYDHHGSANDRMMAHYLLGCTYRDLKEAPMALQCYYDAVESADTLDRDCDFSTMMSIWGQIAITLDKQAMPMMELDAWGQYQRYSLICKDTLNYLVGKEREIGAYKLLGDTTKVLNITEEVSDLYRKYGFYKNAANTYASAIYIYLARNNYTRANELQRQYEHEVKPFDSIGNIIRGSDHYYCGKGLYYLGVNKFDSAEMYFRKLLQTKYKLDACRCMMKLYSTLGNTDSMKFYTDYIGKATDEFITSQHISEMYKTQAMYDYSRNQKIAREKEIDALKKTNMLLISVVVLVVLGVCAYFLIRRVKRQKRHIAELAEHTESLENECESKEGEIGNLQKELDLARQYMMQTFSSNVTTDRIITPENWETIRLYLNLIYNNFATRLHLEFPHLTEEDIKYCMLIKMGFSTQTLAQIYGIAEKSVKQKSYMFKEKLGINESDVSLRQFLADF